VRLLFDANLSPTLVAHLRSHFPGGRHVRDIGLAVGSDAEIWAFAKAENDVIVSKIQTS
jgi:predicted nuclease of predicted toxin-antitoxin system